MAREKIGPRSDVIVSPNIGRQSVTLLDRFGHRADSDPPKWLALQFFVYAQKHRARKISRTKCFALLTAISLCLYALCVRIYTLHLHLELYLLIELYLFVNLKIMYTHLASAIIMYIDKI